MLFWNSGLWKKGEFVNVWGTPWAEGPAPRVGDEIFGTLNNPHTSTLTIWERFGTCTRPPRPFGSDLRLVLSHPGHLAVFRDFNFTCSKPTRAFTRDSEGLLSLLGHLRVIRKVYSAHSGIYAWFGRSTQSTRAFTRDWGLWWLQVKTTRTFVRPSGLNF